MKTPNPQGYTKDKTWERLRLAIREGVPHWSYDETRASKKARKANLLASL